MIKASIPKGTRDFAPEVVRKRNYILNIIREKFELAGFQPLETPAMENLSTLTGKYGEEGDKLMFKILDNGDILGRADQARDSQELANLLCEKALRYDLTIPFGRFVAMNRHNITMPFKRYQIQPVWRADRPQKGRYREFYQCDADVVGSDSLLNEIELLQIYFSAFETLKLGVDIHINNRKILSGLAEMMGQQEKLTDITIAIDKLDKIGLDGVKKELGQRGISDNQIKVIEQFLDIEGTNDEKLEQAKGLLANSRDGMQGIQELTTLLSYLPGGSTQKPTIDFTLARGLNYYTGTIIEVKARDVKMGSIGGGGRYDDLTGLFGYPDVPGVGISFGVDRIYDVMEELKLFPEMALQATKVLFLNMGDKEVLAAMNYANILRQNNIAAEVFPDQAKFDKQLKYADKNNIPYAAIIGEAELQQNQVSIKNLITGKQEAIPNKELVGYFGR